MTDDLKFGDKVIWKGKIGLRGIVIEPYPNKYGNVKVAWLYQQYVDPKELEVKK